MKVLKVLIGSIGMGDFIVAIYGASRKVIRSQV